MPETPKWFISKGRTVDARQAVCMMYGIDSLDGTTSAKIDQLSQLSIASSAPSSSKTSSPKSFFNINVFSNDSQSKNSTVSDLMTEYRYPIFVIVAIQTLAQFTGGVVIRNYAPEIFEESGISDRFALGLNIALGIVKLGTTVWAVTHVEDLGRKQLLLRCKCLSLSISLSISSIPIYIPMILSI